MKNAPDFALRCAALAACLEALAVEDQSAARPCPDFGAQIAAWQEALADCDSEAALAALRVETAPFIDREWTVTKVPFVNVWTFSTPAYFAAVYKITQGSAGFYTVTATAPGLRRYPDLPDTPGTFDSLEAAAAWAASNFASDVVTFR